MITKRNILTQRAALALIFLTALAVNTSLAVAGFEWVPAKKKKAAPVESVNAEPMPIDDVVLPLPGEAIENTQPVEMESEGDSMAEKEEPVIVIPEIANDAPMSVAPPVEIAKDQDKVEKPDTPTRIAIIPNEEPDSGAVIPQRENRKTKIIMSEPMPSLDGITDAETVAVQAPEVLVKEEMSMDLAEQPLEDVAQEAEVPDMETDLSNEKILAAPVTARNNVRVVMPEDAPQSAVSEAKKDGIVIAAFPSQEDLAATGNVSAPAEMPLNADDHDMPMSSDFSEVVGFAKDIPLALALRQVVPADYSFSFGEGVNPGASVSWDGGKPWNKVVMDMVGEHGYGVTISEKSVHVHEQKSNALQSPVSIEPAAGESEVERERSLKRVRIEDPGADADTQINELPDTL